MNVKPSTAKLALRNFSDPKSPAVPPSRSLFQWTSVNFSSNMICVIRFAGKMQRKFCCTPCISHTNGLQSLGYNLPTLATGDRFHSPDCWDTTRNWGTALQGIASMNLFHNESGLVRAAFNQATHHILHQVQLAHKCWSPQAGSGQSSLHALTLTLSEFCWGDCKTCRAGRNPHWIPCFLNNFHDPLKTSWLS